MLPILRLSLLVVGLLAVAGCGAGAGTTPVTERPARSAPPAATVPPSDEPIVGEVPSEILAAIVADAAERTGAAEEAVELVTAMQMTFSDGSLGCPEPGMVYTQALVDGYHVIVTVAEEELDYRVIADGGFRLCERGDRRPSGG